MRRLVPVILIVFGISGCASVGNGPRIVDTQVLDDGAVTITWLSRKSVTYQVLSSNDAATPAETWTVEATVTAAGARTSWTDTAAAGATAKLYRVKAVDETN